MIGRHASRPYCTSSSASSLRVGILGRPQASRWDELAAPPHRRSQSRQQHVAVVELLALGGDLDAGDEHRAALARGSCPARLREGDPLPGVLRLWLARRPGHVNADYLSRLAAARGGRCAVVESEDRLDEAARSITGESPRRKSGDLCGPPSPPA